MYFEYTHTHTQVYTIYECVYYTRVCVCVLINSNTRVAAVWSILVWMR